MAAVKHQRLTGHEIALLGCKVNRDTFHVRQLSNIAGRCPAATPVLKGFGRVQRHFGLDEPGQDCVNLDIAASQFDCK